ncbi:MAG: hypothetical protein M3P08_09560 [Thermoproteota archaeon]|nr:hypothetical protein [Thermoproteota archaeon]
MISLTGMVLIPFVPTQSKASNCTFGFHSVLFIQFGSGACSSSVAGTSQSAKGSIDSGSYSNSAMALARLAIHASSTNTGDSGSVSCSIHSP